MDNKSRVQIPETLIPGRTDEDFGDVPPMGSLSWQFYYLGFPSSDTALVGGWFQCFFEACQEGKVMSRTVVNPVKLWGLHPGCKLFKATFARATHFEWVDIELKNAQQDDLSSQLSARSD